MQYRERERLLATQVIVPKAQWRKAIDIYTGRNSAIPPMAIGGWLKSILHSKRGLLCNPPDGNRGIVKVQPSLRRGMTAPGAWRLDLNHPPIAIGGIAENAVAPCRSDLTIPRLPSGGFQISAGVNTNGFHHKLTSGVPPGRKRIPD